MRARHSPTAGDRRRGTTGARNRNGCGSRADLCRSITEDAYLHALAASLGTSYDRLETLRRSDVPLSDAELIRAAVAGLMPIRKAGRIVWIIAPSCWAAHRLTERGPVQRRIHSFRLTSSDRLQRFIAQHTQATLGRRAAYDLRHAQPQFSNAARLHVGRASPSQRSQYWF